MKEKIHDNKKSQVSFSKEQNNLKVNYLQIANNLIDLVNVNNLQEIEIKVGDVSVRVVKSNDGAKNIVNKSRDLTTESIKEITDNLANKKGKIRSPMVGMFYRRSSPTSAPFVQVGDKVDKGQKLCLIEAMKTFNEIVAPCNGVVKEILIEDSQPVEYNQVIMMIE